MKKILLAIIIGITIASILFPFSQINGESCKPKDGSAPITCAAGERPNDKKCCPEGLMVCGTPCCRCRLCDFFSLLDKIIDFAMFKIAPIAAVLLLIVGGVMFLISSGDPSRVTKAKDIIKSVIIGLVIMYSSYMVVGLILKQIGLATWTQEMYSSWLDRGVFEIDCGDNPTPGP
jgi:di/tricarboxylate transporter